MSQTITDHLDRLLTKPLGFLTNELFIVAMFATFFFLLSVVTRLAGGHDFGWPFVAGITLSQGLLATLGFLALLDLWVFISLLAALRSGSEPRQRIKARLLALSFLGLATCGALYSLFSYPSLIALGVVLIGSTALIWAYVLIAAPRLTPGVMVRGLGLMSLMILILWLPLRAAYGEDGPRQQSPLFSSKPRTGQALINRYQAGERDCGDVKLHGAKLTGANLAGADLRDADLADASLAESELTRADLRGTDLTGALLRRVYLSEASLYEARTTNADLMGADLGGTNTREATLHGSDLYQCNLIQTDLGRAEIRDADLSRADLSNAKLKEASVTGDQLSQTASLQGATLPDGTVHD